MIFSVTEENHRKIGVYRIRNTVNNKVYVGSTTTNFRHRYLQYCSAFRRKLDNQPVLYRAFRKYGFDNFVFEIICVCEESEVLIKEQYYIDRGVDYNACLIAGSLLGLKHSETSKTRTVVKGRHHSAVSVDMYTLEGIKLKTFTSIIEASQYINIKSPSNIMQCCKGNIFSSGGYRWAYKDEVLKERPNRLGKHKLRVFNENEEFVIESHREVIKFFQSKGFTKASQGNLSKTIKRKIKFYGYYIEKI